LHRAGVALDTKRCHGIIIVHLQHAVPQIFVQKVEDGSMFQCSDSWVQTFLYENLRFTMHKAT
ncbi:hypothetical protein PAXRUDRAFT_139653, partial [Paxillus rubicundulus Ve08.2h10]